MSAGVFRDKVVVLTGASAGIGLEIARQLSSEGAALVLAARNPDLLESAANECRATGAHVVAVPTDVAERLQCEALIQKAVAGFGRIDVLINNAGISMHARFDELTDPDAAERIMRINYLGSVWCTYYALPHIKRTRGRIVAVASLTAINGVPTRTLYAASKHAMRGFFDSLRIELRPAGVSVTVVYPGFVATDIAHRALAADGGPLGERPVDKGSVMSAEECARLTIEAAARRRREVVMTRIARVGILLKGFVPDLVDRVAERKVRRGR